MRLAANSPIDPSKIIVRVRVPRLLASGDDDGNPVATIDREYGETWIFSRLLVVDPVRVHHGSLASPIKSVTMELANTIGSILRRKARGSLGVEVKDFFPLVWPDPQEEFEERAMCERSMVGIGVA